MNLDKNIGWCTHTHNPMTGCLNKKLGICNVEACYAQKTSENPFYRKAFPYGFEPHFYPERLNEVQKLRKPAIIFMDSMSDTFGSWWADEEIEKVLHIMDCMRGVHWHKYVDLTKNPQRMYEILKKYIETDGVDRLQNVYFGTSVSGLYDIREIIRIDFLKKIHELGYKTLLSIEPLLYDPVHFLTYNISWLDWIIIGGQTKPTKIPPGEWVKKIIYSARFQPHQPVFCKDTAGSEFQHLKGFPVDLLPIAHAWGKI